MSLFPRFPVRGQHLSDGGGVRLGSGRKHFFNCTCYPGKWDSAGKKRLYRYFVRRVQGYTVRPTLLCCLIGQPQTRESLKIRFLKVKMPQGGQVEGQARGRPVTKCCRKDGGPPWWLVVGCF